MNPVLVYGLVGLGIAAAADFRAYSKAPEGQSFNWRKAFARWAAGAITGMLAGSSEARRIVTELVNSIGG